MNHIPAGIPDTKRPICTFINHPEMFVAHKVASSMRKQSKQCLMFTPEANLQECLPESREVLYISHQH